MYRDRRLLLVVPVLAFLLIAISLYTNSAYLARVVQPAWHLPTSTFTHSTKPHKDLEASTSEEPNVQPIDDFHVTSTSSLDVLPAPTAALAKPLIANGQ